jgi:hypothetical protein
MHTKFWSENLKGKDQTEDLGVDGRKFGEKVWNGCIWLRIGTSGELLWMW